MCLKHKYRRRGSSNAAAAPPPRRPAAGFHSLDDRLIRSVAATPSHLALSTPRLAASASLGALLEQPHRPDPSSDMPDDEADELPSHRDDDAAVLSSLYQRYRDRGLDPSNALHELRTSTTSSSASRTPLTDPSTIPCPMPTSPSMRSSKRS